MTASNPTPALERDPVCGMNVNPATAKHTHEHAGKTYYFCCAGCANKFKANPQGYLNPPAPKSGLVTLGAPAKSLSPVVSAAPHVHAAASPEAGSRKPEAAPVASYVCPMCPEVREPKPGACPSCGMALEPDIAALRHAHRIHLPHASANRAPRPRFVPHLRHGPRTAYRDRRASRKSRTPRHDPPLLGRRRAHRAAACDRYGKHVLAALVHARNLHHYNNRRVRPWASILPWLEFLLATPVVLWCALPFFQRFWTSLVNRSPNMFTLIGLGTGVAYLYSVVATIAPQIFPESMRSMGGYPDVYFEAAAAITTLVLLGQVMELRARSRTSAAILALLDLSPKTARLISTRRDGKRYSSRASQAGRQASASAPAKKFPSTASSSKATARSTNP